MNLSRYLVRSDGRCKNLGNYLLSRVMRRYYNGERLAPDIYRVRLSVDGMPEGNTHRVVRIYLVISLLPVCGQSFPTIFKNQWKIINSI